MLAFAGLFSLTSPENSPELRSSALSWYQSTGLKQETVKTEEIESYKNITYCFFLSSLL